MSPAAAPPNPPKAPPTPPAKRPDRHYDFGRMNMVFALSSLGLLAGTLWMVFADYAQPWKRYQAEFRSLEHQKLMKDEEAERQKIDQQQVAQLRKDIDAARAQLSGHRSGAADLEAKVTKLNAQIYSADAAWKKAKGELDASRFEYDQALQGSSAGRIADRGKDLERRKRALDDAKKAREEWTSQRDAVAAQLAAKKQEATEGQKKLDALEKGVADVEKRASLLGKGADYFVLNAPLMDFSQPSLHIQQVILPGLYRNVYFTDLERVDRCMTCHVAANRPGFDGPEWKEPFRTHPNLAVYVGDGSPHPFTKFGCTTCHGGLDRATDFSRAGHSPESLAQMRDWQKRLGWERQPYLENPILPAKMSEAGCVTCHSADVWTGSASTQGAGQDLIVHMGCANCHVIDYPAFRDVRKPGPDLSRIAAKTNPGWAYWWIAAPRNFHPTTFMPHFFFQENIKGDVNVRRQKTEISAIVSYLWAKSEHPTYAPAPAGNAQNGQKLFESVGCAGCHVKDRNAKRDDFFPLVKRLHGPNLVRTGSKVSPGWLYAWLKNPKQYFPETAMPSLRLSDQEAADLAAFLLADRDPRYENQPLPAPDPKLRDELALVYLQNNETVERSQADLAKMSEAERNVYLGQQTITKYGCYSCHTIAGFEGVKPIGTELTTEGSKPLHQLDFGHIEIPETRHGWVFTKLKRPRIYDHGKEPSKDYNDLLKMPNFGMSDREAEAVLTNVMGFTKESVVLAKRAGNDSRTAALADGRNLIQRYNCQGCHLIEGRGHAIKDLIQDPAMLPPNLAAEGARVQSDWLFKYLHDPSRVKMRPWLSARMPTFGFTDEQANAVIAYFASREQRQPFLSPFPGAEARDLAVGGVVFNLFQCAKCHPAGAEAAKATGVSPDLAPSLLLAHDRLRHDWVPSWVKDPQKWVPGTRMPSNFPESSPGHYDSPVAAVIDSPAYAAQKAQMMRYFKSEAELKAYLADVDKVTAALRDHIWSLASGAAEKPAPAQPTAPGPVGASHAGGR
jgi:cytochrome c2